MRSWMGRETEKIQVMTPPPTSCQGETTGLTYFLKLSQLHDRRSWKNTPRNDDRLRPLTADWRAQARFAQALCSRSGKSKNLGPTGCKDCIGYEGVSGGNGHRRRLDRGRYRRRGDRAGWRDGAAGPVAASAPGGG